MSILDERNVALQGGDHVHLHLQRTLLPYTQFIYPFDDISPSVSFFSSSAPWKWYSGLSPSPAVSGFICSRGNRCQECVWEVDYNELLHRIIAIIALNSSNKWKIIIFLNLYSYLNKCCYFCDYNNWERRPSKSSKNQKVNRRNNNSDMKHCANEKMGNQVAYDL